MLAVLMMMVVVVMLCQSRTAVETVYAKREAKAKAGSIQRVYFQVGTTHPPLPAHRLLTPLTAPSLPPGAAAAGVGGAGPGGAVPGAEGQGRDRAAGTPTHHRDRHRQRGRPPRVDGCVSE